MARTAHPPRCRQIFSSYRTPIRLAAALSPGSHTHGHAHPVREKAQPLLGAFRYWPACGKLRTMSRLTAITVATVLVMLALAWAGLWTWVYAVAGGGAVLWAFAIADELRRLRVRLGAAESDLAELRHRDSGVASHEGPRASQSIPSGAFLGSRNEARSS